MSETLKRCRVQSVTTNTLGRSITSARNQHWVVDEPESSGGPGDSVSPEESFLGGITACAASLIERLAKEEKVPLGKVRARIEGIRTEENSNQYQQIRLSFELRGTKQKHARWLVETFQER